MTRNISDIHQDLINLSNELEDFATAEKPEQKRKYPHKVSFYQDMADTNRVRGAILHTMISEGNRNLSQFIHNAVMKEVERLEAEYNGGKPWPPAKANDMPKGAASHADKED